MSSERTREPFGSQKNPGNRKIVIDRETLVVYSIVVFLAGLAVGCKCAEGIRETVTWLGDALR